MLPISSPGAILALIVIVVCVVAIALLALGQGLGASTEAVLVALFGLVGVTAAARLL